jgi:sugar lactone lactonase YvrE
MRNFISFSFIICALLSIVVGCKDDDDGIFQPMPQQATLVPVASSYQQWTGVAVTSDNKVFMNYPRWSDTLKYSVAMVVDSTTVEPFPDATWNTWNPTLPPGDRFVCVQSVYVDKNNFLWVLDPASPKMQGVVPGGAKLLKFDPSSKQLLQKIVFPDTIAIPRSYLNDVRIDTEKNIAYITDSGAGAIVVVDLNTGQSRRLLDKHFSTKFENLILRVDGRTVRDPKDESIPSVHSDGIALSNDRAYLYYHALTGNTLYRVSTDRLTNATLPEDSLEARVEVVGNSGTTDGMILGPDNGIYQSSFEIDAITRVIGSRFELVVQDERLKWPDSFSLGPDSTIYVTTSQYHLKGNEIKEPYRIFKFKIPGD